jgi:hypothetical protein
MNEVLEELNKKKAIIFGPFVGEFGWEIYKWAPFVKWYAKTYKNKRIIISTRVDRKDLYYGCGIMHTFQLENDYGIWVPRVFGCDIPKETFKRVRTDVCTQYPNAFLFNPCGFKYLKNLSPNYQDFDYRSHPDNEKIIDEILQQNSGKIPIVIASRHRIDVNKRNWGLNNWNDLFKLIESTGKYIVFVAGSGKSYHRAYGMKGIVNLEDYSGKTPNSSTSGLMIAAIRKSVMSVGSQSAFISLSNFIGTPTLFWGHQIKRHSITENLLHTKSIGILDTSYTVKPEVIFNQLNKFVETR